MSLDLASLVAVDVHTHAEVSEHGHQSLPDDLMAASSAYFKTTDGRAPSLDELATYYRERRMAAVVFTVDSEHELGHAPVPNDDVARAALFFSCEDSGFTTGTELPVDGGFSWT